MLNETRTARPPVRVVRKQAIAHAIERITVDLALEHGVDQVTVELVCQRALISPRTFYNYFPSKEAALFGLGPQPSEPDLDAFRTGTSPDVVGDLLELFARTAAHDAGDPDLVRDRRQLIQREPVVLMRGLPRFDAFVAELTQLTLTRLEAMGRTLVETPDLREEASMIVTLAAAVMHRSLHARIRTDDDSDPRADLAQSIALARRILASGRPAPTTTPPPAPTTTSATTHATDRDGTFA